MEKNELLNENPKKQNDEPRFVISESNDDNHNHHRSESGSHHHSHHHSSHHHSHHHSKKHSGKKNRLMKKLKNSFKGDKKLLMIIISVFTAVVVLCLGFFLIKGTDDIKTGIGQSEQKTVIPIEVSTFTEPVSLANEAVVEYMNSSPHIIGTDVFKAYRKTGRLDKGLGVTLSYSLGNLPSDIYVTSANAEVWEESDFENAWFVSFSGAETSLKVYNLKSGTHYFYRINVMLSDGSLGSGTGEFYSGDYPRILNYEGAVNVRDIGGWTTENNQKIKQGLLFRGSELDGRFEKAFRLTNSGAFSMLNELKIKTDMDLRAASENTVSPLGIGVEHNYYNSPAYSDVFSSNGKEKIRRIFSDLANPDNYPIYLHCTHGVDRTGTVSFILEALLGVSEDNLIRDYELSGLYYSDVSRESKTEFVDFLNKFKAIEGDTFAKKAETYLLSAGVSQKEIESIRTILLEN